MLLSSRETDGIYVLAITHAGILAAAGNDVTVFVLNDSDLLLGQHAFRVRFLKRRLGFWPGNEPWVHGFSLLPPPLHLPVIGQCVKPLAEYETVIAYDTPTAWLGYYARKKYGVRYVYFNEGLPLPGGQSLLSRISDGITRRLYTQADLVAAESGVVAEALRREYKVPVTGTGCLTDTYLFNLSVSGANIREKYALGKSPLILFIDMVNAIKRVDMLLDAYYRVKRSIPEARLMVLGRYSPESLRQEILAKSDPSVIHVGYVPHAELPAYYAAATVFTTCASWEEGCSHTILEAQACGKPAVAFALPPHHEVIADGETGLLVDVQGDAHTFAAALLKILSDPGLASAMGAAAAKRVSVMTAEATENIRRLAGPQ